MAIHLDICNFVSFMEEYDHQLDEISLEFRVLFKGAVEW